LDPNGNQPPALSRPGAGLIRMDSSLVDQPVAPDAELRPASAESPGARQFSPWQLLGYRWSILGTFLLVAGLGVAGIWLLLVPRYKATALIEVSPVIPQLLAGQSDMVPLYESYRGSQADYITNAVVLNGVLDDATVRQTRWYRGAPASVLELLLDRLRLRSTDPPLDRLSANLKADVPKGRQLILVSMTTSTPGEAKLIVDKVLEHYVRFTNERASASETELMTKLRKEIGDRKIELESLESAAAQLRQQLGTGAPEDLVRERALGLLRLETTIAALETDLAVAAGALDAVPQSGAPAETQPGADVDGPADPTASAASMPSTPPAGEMHYVLDSRWQQLNDRLAAARREVDRRAGRFGESDPRLAELRKERDDLEAELLAWQAQLDQLGTPGRVDSGSGALRESVQQMNVRLALLKQQLAADQEKARLVFTDAERLAQKTAERSQTQSLQQQLEQRLNEMRMNREVAGRVRTFPAVEPAKPDNDKRWKLTAAAFVGALGVAVGLAFLRIKLSPTVDQVVELARPVHSAFLGHLPLGRTTGVLRLEESAPHLESVRMIRTALLNRLGGVRGVVVQITSATVGSGKSTLAVLLARSLAQSGQRVLLVDADLRRPTLAERFSLAPQPGLCDVLTDRRAIPGIQSVAGAPGLSVLPAGLLAHDADRELITNGAFSSLLDQWRSSFDLVLLDSAPLLGLADAAILAGRVDGTVLVVREHYCRREAVLEALAVLGTAGGRLLGTVFVGSRGLDRYGYAYGYGYGYERPSAPVAAEEPRADQPRSS